MMCVEALGVEIEVVEEDGKVLCRGYGEKDIGGVPVYRAGFIEAALEAEKEVIEDFLCGHRDALEKVNLGTARVVTRFRYLYG